MRKGLNILAMIVLAATVAAAGAVLYGMKTLMPQVVSVTASSVVAAQAQDTLDAVRRQIDDGHFAGRVFGETDALDAQNLSFVTYTVRLKNNGFFPAEWISLDVTPLAGDVLQLENGGANVLYAGAQGDIAVTLLTGLDPAQQPREIGIECYVFGRKQTASVSAQ